ncbi:MAG: chloride channel protein [Thermomicrobiales bacterium]|nr:chloride channel protein [Thermomicrobiales bacterium]MCO5226517.1 chloride channel protein [Thermomicrobiales bacterium]MCO5227172.1 chloride channel protein [Thermomicrobiales bacterium]
MTRSPVSTSLIAFRDRFRSLTRGQDGEAGFEGAPYLLKWLCLSVIIGTIAGLGAVLFSMAIHFATEVFLGKGVGYIPPLPLGEGSPVETVMERPWLLPLITMLGGLLSGIIVFRWAPEAEGHGTDAAIESIHFRNATSNPKVPPIKLLASAVTIGSGGSGGREGPAAQISAGFASILATTLRLSPADRRIAVSAGMGAGIGAIFRAPLGGALMAAEILYIHDIEVAVLMPALMSSIVAYSVFGVIEGWEPIFGSQPDIAFRDPVTLVWYIGLGLLAGIGGILYCKTFYGTQRLFHRWHIPPYVKPAVGGLLVGIIGVGIHGTIATGYGWVQMSMGPELMTIPLWTVIMLPFAKMITTSLSIGSGGSGGIFGPGMVIGGMLGATVWRLGHNILPHMPASPAPFVIVGMMALFGSVAHAPFAMMLMVAEMTGNLSLLAPAMICVAVATAVVGNTTIYASQLPDRSHAPAHRMRMSFPLLHALTAADAMQPLTSDRAVEYAIRVDDSTPLDEALTEMTETDRDIALVTRGGEAVGELTHKSAMLTYQHHVSAGTRRINAMPTNAVLVETIVKEQASISHMPLRDIKLPPGTLVVAILRQQQSVTPTADTELRPGDVVTAVSPIGRMDEVRRRLSS